MAFSRSKSTRFADAKNQAPSPGRYNIDTPKKTNAYVSFGNSQRFSKDMPEEDLTAKSTSRKAVPRTPLGTLGNKNKTSRCQLKSTRKMSTCKKPAVVDHSTCGRQIAKLKQRNSELERTLTAQRERVASTLADAAQKQDALERKHREFAKLTDECTSNMAAQEQRNRARVDALQGTIASLKKEVSTVAADGQRRLDEHIQRATEQVTQLRDDCAQTLQAACAKERENAERKAAETAQQHRRRVMQVELCLKQDFKKQIGEFSAHLTEEQSRADTAMQQLKAGHVQAMLDVASEHDENISQLNRAMASAKTQMCAEHDAAMAATKQQMSSEHDAAMADTKQQMASEHDAAMAATKQQMSSEHDAAMAATKQQICAEYAIAKEQVSQKHNAAMAAVTEAMLKQQQDLASAKLREATSLCEQRVDMLDSVRHQMQELVGLIVSNTDELTDGLVGCLASFGVSLHSFSSKLLRIEAIGDTGNWDNALTAEGGPLALRLVQNNMFEELQTLLTCVFSDVKCTTSEYDQKIVSLKNKHQVETKELAAKIRSNAEATRMKDTAKLQSQCESLTTQLASSEDKVSVSRKQLLAATQKVERLQLKLRTQLTENDGKATVLQQQLDAAKTRVARANKQMLKLSHAKDKSERQVNQLTKDLLTLSSKTAPSADQEALLKRVRRLQTENLKLSGHNNLQQRIKHVAKLKKENMSLKRQLDLLQKRRT